MKQDYFKKTSIAVAFIALNIAFVFQARGTSAKPVNVEHYLAKNAIVNEATPPKSEYESITAKEALSHAIVALKSKGIKNIKIHQMQWIVAPLGGFLIDGKGDLPTKKEHSATFRIGVRDGSEENAGQVFVFFAKAKNANNKTVWHPTTGPDQKQPATAYEFLDNSFYKIANKIK